MPTKRIERIFEGGDTLFPRLSKLPPVLPPKRLFAPTDPLVAETLEFVPEIHRFAEVEEWEEEVRGKLPQASSSTRAWIAATLARRYAPGGVDDLCVRVLAGADPSERKEILAQRYLLSEDLPAAFLETLVFPRLKRELLVSWDVIKAFVTIHLGRVSASSTGRVARALSDFGLAERRGWDLLFRPRKVGHRTFLYALLSEFIPGRYSPGAFRSSSFRHLLLIDDTEIERHLVKAWGDGLVESEPPYLRILPSAIEALRQG